MEQNPERRLGCGAQNPILTTTITLERLAKRSYESMLDYYKQVSPQLNACPELVSGNRPEGFRDGVRASPCKETLAGRATRLAAALTILVCMFQRIFGLRKSNHQIL